MRAFRILAPGQTDVVEMERPVPTTGEVLLKVLANGLCHSDLVIRDLPSSLPGITRPVTMGHEIAGEVVEAGPAVDQWSVGDRAVSYVLRGCGTCRPCRAESDNLCRRGYRGIGTHFDGGLAEYVAVQARYLVPIGDLDPTAAAPLADAGMTAYHAVDRARAQLNDDAAVLVIGVGGLGHMAVQIVKAVSAATVIAIDISPERLELARELGADAAFLSSDDVAAQVTGFVGVEGVAATLDFVGADATLALAGSVTKGGGVVVVPGQGNGKILFTASIRSVLNREVAIMQTQAGSLPDLRAVVELARQGRITAHTVTYALHDTNRALLDLDAGLVMGRAVVVP